MTTITAIMVANGTHQVIDIDYENVTFPSGALPQPVVDAELYAWFRLINAAIIGEIVAAFGVGSNMVNLVIFLKMGFGETVNISLFALAISDFMSSLTAVWFNLCINPWFQTLEFPFYVDEIHYLSGGWPHLAFSKVTIAVTAFITLERCLCVTFPLKVKFIFTRTRVIVILVCLYVVVLALFAPAYYIYQMGMKHFPHLNKTLIGLIYAPDRFKLESVFFLVRDCSMPLFLFVFISVCTTTLVVQLNKKRAWRHKTASSAKTSNLSSRDAKVSKMVISVSVLFILCYTPHVITTIPQIIFPEFNVQKRYNNLLYAIYSFNFILGSVNACSNVFIYYTKSTNYREQFDRIFRRKKQS